MNQEDIIRMAREAGLFHFYDSEGQCTGVTDASLVDADKDRNDDRLAELLMPFAKIVEAQARAEERKACAEAVELARVHQYVWYPEGYHVKANDVDNIYKFQHERCMEAIRARGEK